MKRSIILFALTAMLALVIINCQDEPGYMVSQDSSDLLMVGLELASIGDFVWYDENMNGIQDTNEVGIPNAVVILYNCNDSVIADTATDGNGNFLFTGIAPGDYYLKFIAPDDYVFTLQDQGSDDELDSDADTLTGMTVCTTLDNNENDLSWDAGMYEFDDGCTRSKGYWKNHAGFGNQPNMVTPLLPIWLGDEDDSLSIEVADSAIAVDIFKMRTYGHPSNGITKLYAQLLAAKLNIENGANGEDIVDVIDNADDFLAGSNWENWNDLSQDDRAMILDWKNSLDDYNNGIIGPGSCDEENLFY